MLTGHPNKSPNNIETIEKSDFASVQIYQNYSKYDRTIKATKTITRAKVKKEQPLNEGKLKCESSVREQ